MCWWITFLKLLHDLKFNPNLVKTPSHFHFLQKLIQWRSPFRTLSLEEINHCDSINRSVWLRCKLSWSVGGGYKGGWGVGWKRGGGERRVKGWVSEALVVHPVSHMVEPPFPLLSSCATLTTNWPTNQPTNCPQQVSWGCSSTCGHGGILTTDS